MYISKLYSNGCILKGVWADVADVAALKPFFGGAASVGVSEHSSNSVIAQIIWRKL
jgi:hypothetical protein